MVKAKTCELCGGKIELGWIEKHHIVPVEVTQQAGLKESKIVTLCHSCHQELHNWYSAKVADMAYNTMTKRFEPRSWSEMFTEYESTFNSFVQYKKEKTKH